MKERLVTLVFALGALALFAVMFLKRDGTFGGRSDVPIPVSAERRGSGYHAAMTWLESEGIRSISLRERYDTLRKREDLAPRGNLLIVTLPARGAFNTAEFLPLDRWIRAGNTLLVLAALSDSPNWATDSGVYAWSDVNLLTGLEFETVRARDVRLATRARRPLPPEEEKPEAFRAFSEPVRTYAQPNRSHAYFNGVSNVVALSDYPQRMWTVKVPYQGFVLSLAHERQSGEGALWTRPLGNGRIIVSSFGSIFTNRVIGLADNAKLLANIVGANVGEGGAVLFDDVHQGLGATYDPNEFYRDRRLYITIGVLVALWLIWVLGSTRLRLSATRSSAPRETELVRAAGGFLSRVLPAHAGARRLLDNFFRRVSLRAGVAPRADGRPPWDLIERSARVTTPDIEQLRRWYADAHASKHVPLRALYNLILRLDRQMAT